MDKTMKPLSGLRVLDLSRILAGPFVGQMLGDLGAEVIKIERPGRGDDGRTYGPPFLKDRDGNDTTDATFYLAANRNKKSVTVDLTTPEGQEIVRGLAAMSDVVLENYKVGTLRKYGLDADSIKQLNPRVVYVSVTGFGQTGPYSHKPGYDSVFQGMGGLMSVTGEADDVPGGGPMKVGPSIVDIITGLYACIAVLSALYHRDARDGSGQSVDMSLLDCVIASLSHYAQQYLSTGQVPPRRGTHGNGGVPSQMLKCADGAIMLTAGNNEQYERFVQVLGRPDLAVDERFSTNGARVRNRATLGPLLEEVVAHWRTRDLLAALDEVGVPAGPIYDLQQVFDDVHVQQRGMAVEVPHPEAGTLRMVANPIRFSSTPLSDYAVPPRLGQHTREVLGELLHLDAAHVTALAARGVI
jgi:crotonobetainyl-CoA:carnitine CoA-transferase CaiB-like acyl-CoA transferase